MKRIISLLLCIGMLLTVLSGCGLAGTLKEDAEGKQNQSGQGITGSVEVALGIDVNMGGSASISGGDTQTDPNDMTKPMGNDAVSMNALVGSWYWHDKGDTAYLWIFGADGTYVRLRAMNIVYKDRFQWWNNWKASSSWFRRGKYRVRGHVIECFDNVHTRDFDLALNPFDGMQNKPIDTIMNSPMNDPSSVEDFTIHFEFLDAMTLRLVTTERNRDDYYVGDFDYYSGDSHNVVIPTHRIPSREWPNDLLPSDTVEYSGGRIVFVNAFNRNRLYILIDETTRDVYVNYIDHMVQAGWEDCFPDRLEEFKRGEAGFHNTNLIQGRRYEFSISYGEERGEGSIWINLIRGASNW